MHRDLGRNGNRRLTLFDMIGNMLTNLTLVSVAIMFIKPGCYQSNTGKKRIIPMLPVSSLHT